MNDSRWWLLADLFSVQVPVWPFGLGRRWPEKGTLIKLAHAYEQTMRHRYPRR